MKYYILALSVALSFGASANQAVEATLAEVALPPQTAENVQQAESDPADLVEEAITNYISDVEARVAKAGKSHSIQFFSGKASLNINSNDPDWAIFREQAIKEAVIKARESYLTTLNREVVQEQFREFFSSKGQPEPTAADFQSESGVESLLDKAILLAETMLDSELIEQGIDPVSFKKATPEIKQDLFRDSIGTKTMTKAFGDLAGMTVQQVYEFIREDGTGHVGVVMALSARKREQIRALIESGGMVEPIPAKANSEFANVSEALAAITEPYLEMGTKVFYDGKGYPMIVSFGQSGVRYTSDPDERDLEREDAHQFAVDNAYGALAATYNMNGDYARESIQGSSKTKQQTFEMLNDGSVRKNMGAVRKEIMRQSEALSNMTASIKGLTGVNVRHKWRKKHPITGKEMSGVVVVWHPITVQNAELMQSGKTATEIEAGMAAKDPKVKKSGGKVQGRKSADRFDPEDF